MTPTLIAFHASQTESMKSNNPRIHPSFTHPSIRPTPHQPLTGNRQSSILPSAVRRDISVATQQKTNFSSVRCDIFGPLRYALLLISKTWLNFQGSSSNAQPRAVPARTVIIRTSVARPGCRFRRQTDKTTLRFARPLKQRSLQVYCYRD
jgi:hypothetical protein